MGSNSGFAPRSCSCEFGYRLSHDEIIQLIIKVVRSVVEATEFTEIALTY
ncbi:MAG: hypothetical protein ACRD8Z_07310 [Nitrososphaeraceae archaeon]